MLGLAGAASVRPAVDPRSVWGDDAHPSNAINVAASTRFDPELKTLGKSDLIRTLGAMADSLTNTVTPYWISHLCASKLWAWPVRGVTFETRLLIRDACTVWYRGMITT